MLPVGPSLPRRWSVDDPSMGWQCRAQGTLSTSSSENVRVKSNDVRPSCEVELAAKVQDFRATYSAHRQLGV